MSETTLLTRLLLGCVVFCTADLAGAEVFAHKREAEHFEAVVTSDQLIARERYRGATTINGDLSCPLGPAVKAIILPPGTDGRLCFHFLREKCEYTRFQNGEPVHKEELANAVQPRMCIALASQHEAQQLAALVNVGPRPKEQTGIGSTGAPAVQSPAVSGPVSVSDTRVDAVTEPRQPKSAPRVPQQAKAPPPAPAMGPLPAKEAPPASAKTVTHGYTASGRWVTESFVVGPSGNRRISERTYASAYILDDKPGRPPGRYLYIRNKSNRHLLFYGLGNGPQSRLEPGAETVMMLAYGPASQTQTYQATVTLLWFDRN
jgi:hypothetical protein